MPSRSQASGWAVVLAAALWTAAASPASAQLQFSSADGQQTLKFGLLGQVEAERLDTNTTTGQVQSDNIFLRRARLLLNYKLGDSLTVFVQTDTPNLGKGNADGTKNNADMFIQDFVVTYTCSKEFQIDSGMLLTPQSYNHLQSAASLLGVDYGPYSFVESVPLTSRTGRDYGAQIRGYLGGDHFEYRAGIYQGLRGANSTNSFRYAGRLAFYLLGTQTGYYYRGTSLGKTQLMSIGGTFDKQDGNAGQKGYSAYGADFYWDQPVAGGDGLTVQADYNQWDGGTFIPALAKQTVTLLEVGYYLHAIKLQPYVQYSKEDFDAVTLADEKRTQGGLAYYFNGHNSNLKFAYTKIDRVNAKTRNEIWLQYQVFVF